LNETMGIITPGTPLAVDTVLIGEAIVVALLIIAFLMARKHRGRDHHLIMLGAFLLDELLLKPIMIARAFDGTNGTFPWSGTAILPHLALSVVMTVLGMIVILFGFKYSVRKGKNMFLPPKGKLHKIIGYAFIASWLASYLVGLWIFGSIWL
jgi:uncharacterized membrane protein YozB (DUF420 family)